jgi:hypothetical protein
VDRVRAGVKALRKRRIEIVVFVLLHFRYDIPPKTLLLFFFGLGHFPISQCYGERMM